MKPTHFSLFIACALITACATSTPTVTQPSVPKAANKVVDKPTKPVSKPDHLALIPNLPSPDHVQTEIQHDFNADGVLDLALVTVPPGSRGLDGNEAERILTLGIRDGDGFRSIQSTECLALCPQCGGIMGDPYQGVEKGNDGTITVHNYGGSRQRWSVSYTISWHHNAFHVVGIKRTSFDSLKPNTEEETTLNLLTGARTSTDTKSATTHTRKPVLVGTCGGTDPL